MDESLDSILEKCLAVCEPHSPHDAVAVALHACLLADGFVCIATGDEVGVLHLKWMQLRNTMQYCATMLWVTKEVYTYFSAMAALLLIKTIAKICIG